MGIAKEERLNEMLDKRAQTDRLMKFYGDTSVQPTEVNPILEKHNSSPYAKVISWQKSIPAQTLPTIVLLNLVPLPLL